MSRFRKDLPRNASAGRFVFEYKKGGTSAALIFECIIRLIECDGELAQSTRRSGLRIVLPCTTRMQHVPQRSLTAVSTGSGVVIAEAIEREIPHGLEARNEQRFAERYPNVIDDEISALEVLDSQITGRAHGVGVFAQPFPQVLPGDRGENRCTFAPARGNGFADINGPLGSVRIALRHEAVRFKATMVINGVNSGAVELMYLA